MLLDHFIKKSIRRYTGAWRGVNSTALPDDYFALVFTCALSPTG